MKAGAMDPPPLAAAVTGWAVRAPLGRTIEAVADRLLAGERAAADNPLFDARTYPCRLAAAAAPPQPSRHRRFLRRLGLLALEAAAEALAQARATAGFPAVAGDRIGLFFGYGGLRAHWDDVMPALSGLCASASSEPLVATWERGLKLLHPFWMLLHLSNNAHALCAEDLQILGEGVTYGGANAGAQALFGAQAALWAGAIDVALVVAHDSLIEPEVVLELGGRGALAAGELAALRAPYGAGAGGYVPGQAAAALVLERPRDAGPRALARVTATCGSVGTGEDDAPTPSALAGLAESLGPLSAVGLLDGAAQAQPDFDAGERAALGRLLPADMALTACLSGLGQVGAAAALLQTILLAVQLRRGVGFPIAGLREPAAGPLMPLTAPRPLTAGAALGIAVGPPGLGSAVRVDVENRGQP